MSRPPRLQFPGALYHVTSRGNRRADIYVDARDHLHWLDTLADTAARYAFRVHGYCHMPNHFHLLVETPRANLARGMAHLNGAYSRWFNHRHGLIGHLFQARYHAIVLQKQTHLLELARYTARNPVRAKLAERASAWQWSSHRAMLGLCAAPPWLETEWLLSQFGAGPCAQRVQAYADFVDLDDNVRTAAAWHPSGASTTPVLTSDMLIASIAPADPIQLADYAARYADRREAMVHAFLSSQYTMADIARHFRVAPKTVSRAVHAFVRAGR